jgi:hypothetical protein
MRILSGDHQDLDEIGAIPARGAAAFAFAFSSSLVFVGLSSILALCDMVWRRQKAQPEGMRGG